jgi:hypothetical protein
VRERNNGKSESRIGYANATEIAQEALFANESGGPVLAQRGHSPRRRSQLRVRTNRRPTASEAPNVPLPRVRQLGSVFPIGSFGQTGLGGDPAFVIG